MMAGLLERRLVAVEERDGRRVYVPTEVGRAEVDSVSAGGT